MLWRKAETSRRDQPLRAVKRSFVSPPIQPAVQPRGNQPRGNQPPATNITHTLCCGQLAAVMAVATLGCVNSSVADRGLRVGWCRLTRRLTTASTPPRWSPFSGSRRAPQPTHHHHHHPCQQVRLECLGPRSCPFLGNRNVHTCHRHRSSVLLPGQSLCHKSSYTQKCWPHNRQPVTRQCDRSTPATSSGESRSTVSPCPNAPARFEPQL
jgi:hypothetical protein